MSPPYRIEREQMFPGQTEPTYRVIVRLEGGRWGTVQTGLDQEPANTLLDQLMANHRQVQERRALFRPTGIPYTHPAHKRRRR